MKVRKHKLLRSYDDVSKFADEHIGETFKIYKVTSDCIDIMQEIEQTEAEMHMESIRNILDTNYSWITDEEVGALEYAIACIKTLDDMGIIKESNDD